MSELAKTIGEPCVKLTVGSETFTLGLFSIQDYSAFEVWLEENAWAAVHRANAQKWVTSIQHDKNVDRVLILISSEQLAHGSEAYDAAIATYRGLEKMLSLALAKTHPEVSAEKIHKLVHDDPFAVAKAIRENKDASE